MSNITINPKLSAQQRQQLGEYLEFAKPRTIEEANRIGQQYLKDMAKGSEEKFYLNPLGYVTPKAKSRKGVLAKVIMSCQDCHKTYPVIEVPGEGSFSKTKCPFCKGAKVTFEKAYRCDIKGRILDNPKPTGFVLDSSKTKAGAAARIAELKKHGIEAIAQPVKYTNGRQTWVVWRRGGVPMYRKNPKEIGGSPMWKRTAKKVMNPFSPNEV